MQTDRQPFHFFSAFDFINSSRNGAVLLYIHICCVHNIYMPLTLALCYGQLVSVAEVPRVANDKHTHATISICARDGAAGWLSIGPYLTPVAHAHQ